MIQCKMEKLKKRDLSHLEIIFLEKLFKKEDFTTKDFCKDYNVTHRHVCRIVESLVEKNLIEKIKEGYFIQSYKITQEGRGIFFR